MMGPFRELLKPSNAEKGKVAWNSGLEQAFIQVKAAMLRAMEEGVQIFNKDLPTALMTAWAKVGIRHVLSQKHCKCEEVKPGCCPRGWKVVAVVSRFCHPAEQNYSPVEGEKHIMANAQTGDKLGCSTVEIERGHSK